MQGYGSDNATNTEQVETRSATVDTAVVKKFYFNGCTKDFKMALAHTTLYSAGVEFSSRSEISGNTSAHSFSMRSDFIDAATTYASHITIVGNGVSKLDSASTSSPARFIIGYRDDNCGTSSNSATCNLGTAKSFCVKNAGTANTYALESTTTECLSLEAGFGAITPLVRSDIPKGFFDATASAFGL